MAGLGRRKKPAAADSGGSAHPRPSERTGATQPTPREKRPDRPQPSADAMARARARLEPPKAPWAPLPLAELAIVIGGLAVVVAALRSNENGMIAGFLLILLGTAEFSWREHRHGYRSHGAVLAGIVGMAVALAGWKLAGLSRNIAIGAGFVVFLLGWSLLTSIFRQRDVPVDQP